jgi:hypothetical protein
MRKLRKWLAVGIILLAVSVVLLLSIRNPYPRSAHFSAPHQPMMARLISRYWFTPTSNQWLRSLENRIVPTVYAQGQCFVGGTCDYTKSFASGTTCCGETYNSPVGPYPGRCDCIVYICGPTNKKLNCKDGVNEDKYGGCWKCGLASHAKCK